MSFMRLSIPLIVVTLFCSNAVTAESEYEEPMYEEPVYQEPTYEEPVYEDAYQEEAYQEEGGQEYSEPGSAEPSYAEPAYEEPPMDSEQAAMVKEARTNCQLWAQESGLEGEEKAAFIEDCVYSQTGF